MKTPVATLAANLQTSIEAKAIFLANSEQHSIFEAAVSEVILRYQKGGRLYIAGNGGPAGATYSQQVLQPMYNLTAECRGLSRILHGLLQPAAHGSSNERVAAHVVAGGEFLIHLHATGPCMAASINCCWD